MNSIFFGVSDIGISTVVQQTAFTSLVIQGAFYLVVEQGTYIDWWIVTRETIFILLYLVVVTVFLIGNEVEAFQAAVMFGLYIVHTILMKFSNKYEVAIKSALADHIEMKELRKIAHSDISKFHQSVKNQAISIEMLNKVQF